MIGGSNPETSKFLFHFYSLISSHLDEFSSFQSKKRAQKLFVQFHFFNVFMYVSIIYDKKQESKVLGYLSRLSFNFWTGCWGKWQISIECWLNLAESIGEQNLTLLPMFHCKHGPCNEKRYSLCPQGKHVCITGILFLLNTMCLPCTCVCILRQKDWETTLILSLQSYLQSTLHSYVCRR